MWLVDLVSFISVSIYVAFLSIIMYYTPVDASPFIVVVIHLAQGTHIMLTFLWYIHQIKAFPISLYWQADAINTSTTIMFLFFRIQEQRVIKNYRHYPYTLNLSKFTLQLLSTSIIPDSIIRFVRNIRTWIFSKGDFFPHLTMQLLLVVVCLGVFSVRKRCSQKPVEKVCAVC